jgi:hypothetical protein
VAHGKITREIAQELKECLPPRYRVLHDHGESASKDVGRIVSCFGQSYRRGTQLSCLDIAVVDSTSSQVLFLIEIEERSASPKTLLGDAMAVLLGDRLVFAGKDYHVTTKTHLLVCSLAKARGHKQEKVCYIENRIRALRRHLEAGNAKIGEINFLLYSSESELKAKLVELVIQR